MTEVETLKAALKWALEHGISASTTQRYGVRFMDGGCGCCSGEERPPEALRAVLLEAAGSAPTQKGGDSG